MNYLFFSFFINKKRALLTLGIMLVQIIAAARQKEQVSTTGLPFNDDTSLLRFAIVADLWGGLRPAVFKDAVDKLQLLQPQLVLSVGDLIDGKSYDPLEISAQWDEFDKAIKPLGMPFFYVPGNHDISNTIMETEWRKRLGSPYYHFVYKNVLFLCINTEDGGRGGIREAQVAYFRKAIEENPSVRWTFLFMHRPVWQGKGDRQEGYEKIEALLKGRSYTLFSGHHHTYLSVLKNGNKHFVLGSTGGGSDLRGERFGEFDHITLVTLDKTEPRIVNLKLDGIIKEDVVNGQKHQITQTLIDEEWIKPVSYVSSLQKTKSVSVEVKLNNPTDFPVTITGAQLEQGLYKLHPAGIKRVLEPRQQLIQQFALTRKDGQLIDLAALPSVEIPLRATYTYDGYSYSLPASKPLLLSWKRNAQWVKPLKDLKALLSNTDTTGMLVLERPEQLTGPWYWSGLADARVRFKVMQEGNQVQLLAIVNDDQWVNEQAAERDILYLHLEDAERNKQVLSVSPGDAQPRLEGEGRLQADQVQSAIRFENGIFTLALRLPLTALLKSDNSIRINIGYRDQDNVPERQAATLFWKPVWGTADDYKNSGSFIFRKY